MAHGSVAFTAGRKLIATGFRARCAADQSSTSGDGPAGGQTASGDRERSVRMQLKTVTLALALIGSVAMALGARPASVLAAAAPSMPAEDAHGANEAHAAEAEHGAAGGGSLNPVTLDPDLAIVTAIIFLLLLAVLWKFAWGPVIQALDKRERTVADQLAEAKRSQEESRRLLAEHEAKLAGAAAEVKQLLDQARRDADAHKQQIVESAQAAAMAEKDRAVREIHAAKQEALHELAQKSVATAVDLAGQIVHRQLSPDDHSRLIGDALQQFTNETGS
jgi:F-type H+-transporting ATPase subunit b